MSETARRPIPHINHSVALAQAASALSNASVPQDLTPVANPMAVPQVRRALQEIGKWFEDPTFYFPDDSDGELKATEYLVILSTLHREHLKMGNL
jgi:hypothetical protein